LSRSGTIAWGADFANATSSGATPDAGTGRDVACGIATIVEVPNDTGSRVAVPAGEGDARREGDRAGGSDADLDARHVELVTTSVILVPGDIGFVEGWDLGPEKVLSGGQIGDRDGVLTLGSDEFVDGPLATTVRLGEKLDPDVAGAVAVRWRNVDLNGPLVAGCNDVVGPVVMIPLESNSVSGLHVNSFWNGAIVDVARHGRRTKIFDGVVVGRRANILVATVALIDTVHEDGPDVSVSLNGSRKRDESSCDSEDLHFCCSTRM